MTHEETIFEKALGIHPAAAQQEYLRSACAGDEVMLARLEGLVRAHGRAGRFLQQNPPLDKAPGQNPFLPLEATATMSGTLTEKPGDRIGRYKLLQKIGEGGCGVVYMAEQEEPVRRRVALKIIKLGMDTHQVIGRFEAERQALALMDHPNIAKVYDAGATETGRPYFVMELVRGIKITEYCDQKKLGTRDRLELFMQVCRAVQHAHQKGIIHRDIKPSNILVSVNDPDKVGMPKVIDFGIAKATTGEPLTDKTVFTAFEQFIGTPAYMSPEQALVTNLDIDTRADIYALGVLLYELLTGQTPFDSKELLEAGLDAMRRTICEQEPERPSTRLRTLPGKALSTTAQRRGLDAPKLVSQLRGDLDWIVMKCLEKDRTRRYETANGLASDIQRHLNNEPVVACPPSRMYEFQKSVRRHKFGFAAAGGVMAALVIGLALALWQSVEKSRAYERAVAAEQEQANLRKQAQTEGAKSEQVAQFLKDMLKGVDSSVAMGKDTKLLREILDKTAERIGKDFSNQPEVEADLGNTIATVYVEVNEYKKAEELYRRNLALRRSLSGNQNGKIAGPLMGLAYSLWRQAKHAEGEKVIREAIAIQKTLPDSEKHNPADLYNLLGLTVRDQDRTAEAEAIFREGMRAVPQPDNHFPALLHSLAYLLFLQARYPEAEEVYRKGLAICTNLSFVQKHVAEMLDGLAQTLLAEGKGLEALNYFHEGVAMRQKLFGRESTEVAAALFWLAGRLEEQGQLTEAETNYREALALREKLLGKKEPNEVAVVLYNLARMLLAAGRGPEAELLLQDESVVVAAALLSLAVNFENAGKLPEAEKRYRQTLELHKKLLGKNKPEVAVVLANLARMLVKAGRWTDAEPVLRECLEIRVSTAPEDWRTFNTRSALGGSLLLQKKYAEAKPLLISGYEGMKQRETDIPAEGRPRLKEALQRLVQLCQVTGNSAEEAKWRTELTKWYLPELHQHKKLAESGSAEALNNLAWFLATCPDASLRDGTNAIKFAQEAVAKTGRTNASYLDTLAAAYAETGQFEKAVNTQAEAAGLLKGKEQTKEFEDLVSHLKLYESKTPYREP